MCGIVGYLGELDAKKHLYEGLKRLEYRGYDSAGLTLLDRSNFYTKKTIGRVHLLDPKIKPLEDSHIGIAHTRWATHGEVNLDNAHPHLSFSERYMCVHNGVIDNYKRLTLDYLKEIPLYSKTDTEVVINLFEHFKKDHNDQEALYQTIQELEGSFALVILDKEQKDQLLLAKNKSPLIIGRKNNNYMIASDVLALAGFVDEIHVLDDYTFMKITPTKIEAYNKDNVLFTPHFEPLNIDPIASERGDYPHYMLKEIHEQPLGLERLINYYRATPFDKHLLEALKEASSIEIIAAGTSYNAGLVGKKLIETSLKNPVNVHIASELAYYPPVMSDKPLFMFISQSGETADLIACLPIIKSMDAKLITLTNVPTSRLAKEADFFVDLMAGPEIAVASTKAYTAQIAVMALMMDAVLNSYSLSNTLKEIISEIHAILEKSDKIKLLIGSHLIKHHAFYIGRGLDYYLALEASLKLKEVSYIQTEAFPAGELKHGTIALIEKDTPVIALLSEKNTAGLTRANIEEVAARGASSIVIALESLSESTDHVIIKDIHPILNALTMIIPTQLIAYYAALQRGHDIDKPRNLAKSVTVE